MEHAARGESLLFPLPHSSASSAQQQPPPMSASAQQSQAHAHAHIQHASSPPLDPTAGHAPSTGCPSLGDEALPQSKYPGVRWSKKEGRWRAEPWINGKHVSNGTFDVEEDAWTACQDAKARAAHVETAADVGRGGVYG